MASYLRRAVIGLSFSVLAAAQCGELAASVPSRFFDPGTTDYNTSVGSYFFVGSRLTPECVAAPSTATEVAELVSALQASGETRVAIRSGGTSPIVGAAGANEGVVIDLRGLNAVRLLHNNTEVVSVGAGTLWQDVYAMLDPLGVTVVGSRIASVGVGGFLSGGGISFVSPEHGWGCDSIVNIQVVLADGSIVEANAESNADLFQALKGGQGNFGIITRFDLQTYPQGNLWGGVIQYPESTDEAQLEAFKTFKAAPYDPYAEMEQTFSYVGSMDVWTGTNLMYYSEPIVGAAALAVFTEIEPQISNTMRVGPISNFTAELQAFQPPDQYAIYATITFPVSAELTPQIHSLWKEATRTIAETIPSIFSVVTFQSLPPPPAADAPQNSLPFASDSTPHEDLVLTLFNLYWTDPADGAKAKCAMQALVGAAREAVGTEVEFEYLNYAAGWQDPIASYGETINEELRRVAAAYDPEGFFQEVVSGGAKL